MLFQCRPNTDDMYARFLAGPETIAKARRSDSGTGCRCVVLIALVVLMYVSCNESAYRSPDWRAPHVPSATSIDPPPPPRASSEAAGSDVPATKQAEAAAMMEANPYAAFSGISEAGLQSSVFQVPVRLCCNLAASVSLSNPQDSSSSAHLRPACRAAWSRRW